ncbi:MAG: hypothetical protein QOF06_1943 [Solirubrobacterales bacterium]|jgi:hypothetical protein|nr:hypothetical protein [Solirubrobacterales bacterium]
MGPVKLPAGYRLPKGTTMADVRRLDQELLSSEGQVQSPKTKEGQKRTPPEEK